MMKKAHICIFIISLFLGSFFNGFGQVQSSPEIQIDSISYMERYGVRIGADLSKPIRTLLDKDYQGFEIKGDFRITNNLYPAVEIGYEDFDFDENNFDANSKGGYAKLGANYNVYSNWIGMQNEIYVGLRYGFATYSETLYNYTVYDKDHYFPPDYKEVNQKYNNLNAHWVEFQVGIKAEVLHNLYLSLHAQVKRIITSNEPKNFDILWIPGYNRNYADSPFGIGWGYSVSYMIPLLKKERVQKID
ncbi:MAG TPA: DUF6048 family protein [Flavobacteriaceae bacterium]|nr:DUF6048 family protein [Flavobacteriaceae bacterium]